MVSEVSGTKGDDTVNWTVTAITLNSLSGNDNVTTGQYPDHIDGGDGDDIINTGSGNDVLVSGIGNDTLWGGYNDDIYVYNQGDGNDVIYDARYTSETSDNNRYYAGTDTIRFSEGINQTNITLQVVNNNLEITFTSSPEDKITVRNWTNTNNRVERIEFADGSTVNAADLL
jgi:Ca2+-binding RTX toxin-like protein